MASYKQYKHLNKVTKRELEVLELVAKGYTNEQIKDLLFISMHTIDTHLSNLYKKHNLYSDTKGEYSVMRLRLALMYLEGKERNEI